MECAFSLFEKQSPRTTQVHAKLNQHLVPTTRQPKCTFTISFTIGVHIKGIIVKTLDVLCSAYMLTGRIVYIGKGFIPLKHGSESSNSVHSLE
jgi:hypothetical protein